MAEGIRRRVSDRTGRVTYEAAVYVAAEKRAIRRTFPTLAAARKWRSDALRAVREHRLHGPSRVTFRQAAEEWLAEAKAGRATTKSGTPYKPSVLASYEAALNRRVLPAIGARRLEDITTGQLQRLVDRWGKEGLSGSTIRNALMPIRVVYRRAVRRGVVAVNPASGLELPAPARRRERIASPLEVAALLDALAPADRALWSVAFYAGLRSGEIQALRWIDVDLAAGRIHVRRSWDPGTRTFVAPKSRAGARTVPMAGALRDELVGHRMRTGREGEQLVFGRTPEIPQANANILARARRTWERAGLAPFGLHEARHSAVSLWIAAGVNIRQIATYAGHGSTSFSLDRYGHLLAGDEQTTSGLLDAFLARPGEGH